MKIVKRVIAVILLTLTVLAIGYTSFTCGRLPETANAEAVYEQT